MLNRFIKKLRLDYADENSRQKLTFVLLNILLGIICLTMAIVDIITSVYILACITFGFGVLCLVNIILAALPRIREQFLYIMFSAETVILFAFFIVSGIPDGFSVHWVLIAPAFAITALGKKHGIIYNSLIFLMVILFFWIPFGRELLIYEYSDTFMLRFPFVFVCMFIASWYMDDLRNKAYRTVKDSQAVVRHMYRHDALTGLYNRQAFQERLSELFANKKKEKVSVILLDIDDFKCINDKYGHRAGDEVLKEVANIIRKNTCSDCISCRWGGEEFVILMQCNHDHYQIAESILKNVESTTIVHSGNNIRMTLSIGITVADTLSPQIVDSLIDQADLAMYKSKAAGKNCITQLEYQPTTSQP